MKQISIHVHKFNPVLSDAKLLNIFINTESIIPPKHSLSMHPVYLVYENVTLVLTWNSQVAQDFSWPQSSPKHWFPGIAASLSLEEAHTAFTAKGHGSSTSSVWTDLSTYNKLQLAVQHLCNQQMKRVTLIPHEKLINVLQLRTIALINKTSHTSTHLKGIIYSQVCSAISADAEQNLMRPTGKDKIRAKISWG